MSTTHPVGEVEAYITAVRARLADVPDEDRQELLDDVAAHVREVADEFGSSELHARLGSPAEFADELRSSAGYGSPDRGSDPTRAARRVRAWFAHSVLTDANRARWHKLEPGWFLVRGVLVGYLVLTWTGAEAELVPQLGNSRLFGLTVIVACAVGSVLLGERRARPQGSWLRRLRIAAEVGLVLFALVYAKDSTSARIVYVNDGYYADPCLRDSASRPIANLYAFDPSGKAIPQFFLTDQAGRPIDNLCPDQVESRDGGPLETKYAHDSNGAAVYGVFPREQNRLIGDPMTGEVTKHPVSPPAVVFPQLAPTTTEAPPAAQEEAPQQ